MRIEDFDYFLPTDLIAQYPAAERSSSRLLHLDGMNGTISDRSFRDLPQLVSPRDLVVFNDTRVIKARLVGRKRSGGRAEVFVERILNATEVLALIGASHAPAEGSHIAFADGAEASVIERQSDRYRLLFEGMSVLGLLDKYGTVPLPPYIARAPDATDEARYQTVYAREPGAVAAPTAGLHFDESLLAALGAKGVALARVTLHVGAGTFQPVRVEHVCEHRMHREWYHVPQATVGAIEKARREHGRILAVGTTTLRALEGASAGGKLKAGSGETDLFITPGYRFSVVERLVTNFHLPRSTLLMLVSAFAGLEHVRRAYHHAIAERYRFFSYGDAMLIERQT